MQYPTPWVLIQKSRILLTKLADWIRYLEQKLLLATVCVIALTVGAQAKPIQLALIDNRWAIEYDSELFAGACIATMHYDL